MMLATEPRTIRHAAYLRKLAGPEGLILAIINMAAKDAIDPATPARFKLDALDYFCSSAYKHHLGVLGLPGDWLPAGISRID